MKEKQIKLSIVIPVWNRGDTIGRCLDSIFSQDFQEFEVIAVDDASKDDSIAVMESYDDPRLRIIKLSENVGVCAARGKGTAFARAPWILYVDSDDAVNSGTLRGFYERAITAASDIGVLGYCYLEDNGKVTPCPYYPEGPFGLVEYLKREEEGAHGDSQRFTSRNFSYCIRREVFDNLSWPTDRQFESRFMLQIVDRWKWDISRKIGSTVYSDASNRYSDNKQNIKKSHTTALDNIGMIQDILREFGPRLKKYSPTRHVVFFRSCATLHFSIGKRWGGIKYMLLYLWNKPFSLRGWSILLFGLMGPRFFSWAKGKG